MSLKSVVVKCFIFLFLTLKTLTCVKIMGSVSACAGKSSSAAILRDITNAFHTITNDTKGIDYLIPKMFNLSLDNPTYVFRLPQAESVKQSVVIMKRSDFMQPIFPNLTSLYVRLMKNKDKVWKKHDTNVANEVEKNEEIWGQQSASEDDPTLLLNLQTERNFIDYVRKLNHQDMDSKTVNNNNEWGLLGLHGWKGTLSNPHKANRPILSGNVKSENTNFSEKNDVKWDLPGNMQDDNIERNVMQVIVNSNVMPIAREHFGQVKYSIVNMHTDHSDADVYISRANDPFGHSTKWSTKNSSSNPQEDERRKRAVIDLYSMIKCSTGCDPIVYKGYGCYCGFLGSGQPVDGIDRCCKVHDKCYENSNCISYLEYFVPYLWKCYRGKPLCAIDHGEWGGTNSCAATLCNCDLMLSRCLRQFVCPQKRAICKTSKSRMLQNILFNF